MTRRDRRLLGDIAADFFELLTVVGGVALAVGIAFALVGFIHALGAPHP